MQVVERDAAVEELRAAEVARWAARVSLLENIACGDSGVPRGRRGWQYVTVMRRSASMDTAA